MNQHPMNHRRAFTMIEMLFVLILLAVFATIATRVTTTLLRLLTSADTVSEQSAILDDIANTLRTDTWSASTLASTPTTLTLTTPTGPITYTLTPANLTRTQKDITKTWTLPPHTLAFSTTPPHVFLTSTKEGGAPLSFSSEPLRLSLRGAQ